MKLFSAVPHESAVLPDTMTEKAETGTEPCKDFRPNGTTGPSAGSNLLSFVNLTDEDTGLHPLPLLTV